MSLRGSAVRHSTVLAAVTLAACAGDPASPVADASARRPDAAPSFALAMGNTTTVVTGSDVVRAAHNTPATAPWMLYTRDGGTGTFVAGPGTAPMGVGSLQLATPLGNDKAYLFNYTHVGTRLADITALSYRTYRTAGDAQQTTALNIEIDANGAAPGGYAILVFEPVYNTAQGAVASGVWQGWDALAGGQGRWWTPHGIPGVCAFGCYATWSAILAANPDAAIAGGVGVNQGGGNPGLTAAVDRLTLAYGGSSVTYDFEPYRADACKNGGWQNVKDASGAGFDNQGDCVSYVESAR